MPLRLFIQHNRIPDPRTVRGGIVRCRIRSYETSLPLHPWQGRRQNCRSRRYSTDPAYPLKCHRMVDDKNCTASWSV
jgi:hypothetical protein